MDLSGAPDTGSTEEEILSPMLSAFASDVRNTVATVTTAKSAKYRARSKEPWGERSIATTSSGSATSDIVAAAKAVRADDRAGLELALSALAAEGSDIQYRLAMKKRW